MKQTKITFNIDGLDEMVKSMGSKYVTRVGILGSTNTREEGGEYGNAEIGVVHEFGSKTNNIPQRSFLRMPLETKSKDLMKAMTKSSVKTAFDAGDYKKVYELLGVKAEEIVQGAFSSGGYGQWAQLSPSTVSAKGSTRILIDNNELRPAVISDVVNRADI